MEPNINSFLSQTGCMIHQRQGQRFCLTLKALEDIKLLGKGHEVYVGKLPRDCYEYEIYPMFSKAGDIYETRIMMDFSGSNRGFCYVKYFTRQAADNAVELLHNQEIRPGHRLIVRKSLERNTLTVYNVDEREDEITAAKALQAIVGNMTEVRIVEVIIVGILRQAHIEFDCHRSAIKAMKYFAINMQSVFGPNARITWSCPITVKERNTHKALQRDLYSAQLQENKPPKNMLSVKPRRNRHQIKTAFHSLNNISTQFVCSSPLNAGDQMTAEPNSAEQDSKNYLFAKMFSVPTNESNKENVMPTSSSFNYTDHINNAADNATGTMDNLLANMYTDVNDYFQSNWNTSPEEEMGAYALPLAVQDQNNNNNVGNMYSLPRNNSEQEIITAFPRYSYRDNQNVEDSSMFALDFTLGTQHYNPFTPANS